MFRKCKDILNSGVLLQIEPPSKAMGNYLRIFLIIVFAVFSGFMFYSIQSITSTPQMLYISAILYLLLCVLIVAIFIRLKPNSLIFTDKGITDSIYLSAYWDELEFYNFISVKDIGMKQPKRILSITSKKPPLYQLKFLGLQKYFYDRGLFFSEDEIVKSEEIFRIKGIPKEP